MLMINCLGLFGAQHTAHITSCLQSSRLSVISGLVVIIIYCLNANMLCIKTLFCAAIWSPNPVLELTRYKLTSYDYDYEQSLGLMHAIC